MYLCNTPEIVQHKIDKPIIIDVDDKITTKKKKYTLDNIIDYEVATRDSRIGELTNINSSILNKYSENEEVKKLYADLVSLLRVYQG